MSAPDTVNGEGWRIFHATGSSPDGVPPRLPSAPPWRQFRGEPPQSQPPDDDEAAIRRLGSADDVPQLDQDGIDVVNAALILRRPLLVTGSPGIGKSSLAYLISRELGLGRVLEWNIVSRTTLRDGLYSHDAMGRAQAIAGWRANLLPGVAAVGRDGTGGEQPPPALGDFITLGALGTALLPYDRPRVLLVDELDKSDIDLPNDLLHVLENGSYDVPELIRAAADTARVHTADPGGLAEIWQGRVECREFPIVVITSNGEREFPAAFRRRCLPLEMRPPTREQLLGMVVSHFGVLPQGAEPLVDEFVSRIQSGGTHALDQLLNAIQLTATGTFRTDTKGRTLVEKLLRDLSKGR
ncbi:AAA family ATPase [Streptomyces sp. NPDC001351]|uniref:AAA family ATPase n=1 Tax=Streptomyces sp. NPDC001351 TaxID=3364564 RepID=UPI00368C9E7B